MRKTYSREQSYPSPDLDTSDASSWLSNQFEQLTLSKLDDLQQLQGRHISADDLFKIMDSAVVAQKMGMRIAMDANSTTTGSKSDWKLINCYLESTVMLLDACNNIQRRVESIRSHLDLIPIGLHYLEGELEPTKAMLQRAASTLESSRLRDKRHCNKMEKDMSRMRSSEKKLNMHILACHGTEDSISPELYKAISGAKAMAVFAIETLNSATSFNSLMISRNKKNSLPKKPNEISSLDELASMDLAAKTLLKLISSWLKGGSNNLRRMAVKVVAGELRRRKEELEKALSLLEEKIGMLHSQIVALRLIMLGLLSRAQKEGFLEAVNPSSYEEKQMNINGPIRQEKVARIVCKPKVSRRSFSLVRVGQPSIGQRMSNHVL